MAQDTTLSKGTDSLWCVSKNWLVEALPWNGKYHEGAGYAAKLCGVHWGRRKWTFLKNYGLEQCNVS